MLAARPSAKRSATMKAISDKGQEQGTLPGMDIDTGTTIDAMAPAATRTTRSLPEKALMTYNIRIHEQDHLRICAPRGAYGSGDFAAP